MLKIANLFAKCDERSTASIRFSPFDQLISIAICLIYVLFTSKKCVLSDFFHCLPLLVAIGLSNGTFINALPLKH